MDFTSSSQLNYAPTIGTGAQVNAYSTVAGSYNAASIGTLDIGSGAATGASQSVPMGAVAAPKLVWIQNAGPSGSVNLTLQGLAGLTGAVQLNPGGIFQVDNPSEPSSKPIIAVAVAVGHAQPGMGSVRYVILGD